MRGREVMEEMNGGTLLADSIMGSGKQTMQKVRLAISGKEVTSNVSCD
jgi:hypothetical protein